jgi:CheY-like chemotaxis protein
MENSIAPTIHVLVIEDDHLLGEAITKKLSNEGMTATLQTSAKEALLYLSSVQEIPNIIWLDYYLEDMNGLEFMAELKKDQKLQNIPVIVVSNSASGDKVSSMLALGVKKYMLKAENRLEDIVSEIRKFATNE